MKRKYYLIDTENVGDRWFNLLKKLGKRDLIVTFYTEHHSKNLEGYLTKQVHNPKILWLECAAGDNALDYQLIGVLSYLIARHPKESFCIYSNDKDYQSTVDFWKSRGITICQKGFKTTNKKTDKKKDLKKKQKTEKKYVEEIAKSVPTSDLNGWYQALTAILGQETGRNWYLKVRGDEEFREALSKYYIGDEYSRGVNLVATVLGLHNLDVTRAEEAYKIIQSHNRKNLKAIREDFDKRFGKKPPQKYFKVLRPLVRVIKGK